MRTPILIVALALMPLIAVAQGYSSSPIVILGEGAQPAPSAAVAANASPAAGAPAPTNGLPINFPEAAITQVGENTTGQHVDTPANPPSPTAPPNPSTPATPPNPGAPASPTPPAKPVSKLWPRNTIEVFMPSCTNLHIEFVKPCTCVITQLMMQMPHDEFLAKSEAGTIEQDPRLLKIRTDCVTAPQRKD